LSLIEAEETSEVNNTNDDLKNALNKFTEEDWK
jgi:hypothetical protein